MAENIEGLVAKLKEAIALYRTPGRPSSGVVLSADTAEALQAYLEREGALDLLHDGSTDDPGNKDWPSTRVAPAAEKTPLEWLQWLAENAGDMTIDAWSLGCEVVIAEVAQMGVSALTEAASALQVVVGERDEAIRDRNAHAEHVRQVAAEARDGFAALEEIDQCWDAVGVPNNRAHLSLAEQITALNNATEATLQELNARIVYARQVVAGVEDDFMTSERHHPGYVLIPTAKFEELRLAASLLSGSKEQEASVVESATRGTKASRSDAPSQSEGGQLDDVNGRLA